MMDGQNVLANEKGGTVILDILYIYLIIGVTLEIAGPESLDIRKKVNKMPEKGSGPKWKVFGFGLIIFVAEIVLWPILVPFALRRTRQKKSSAKGSTTELMNTVKAITEGGTDENALPNGYGEFGLVVTNPVLTNSKFGSRQYLSSLYTESGQVTTWVGCGSTMNPVSERPIDIYKIASSEGLALTTVYVSAYNGKNSLLAPKGFRIGPKALYINADEKFEVRYDEYGNDPKLQVLQDIDSREDEPETDEINLVFSEATNETVLELAMSDVAASQVVDAEQLLSGFESKETTKQQDLVKLAEPERNSTPQVITGEQSSKHVAGILVRSKSFEFNQTGYPKTAQDFEFLEKGVLRGLECRELAIARLDHHLFVMADPSLEDLSPEEYAETIAEDQGYLDVGSDAGMSRILDGAYFDFDQLRSCFILGVREGLDGVSPEECEEHYSHLARR